MRSQVALICVSLLMVFVVAFSSGCGNNTTAVKSAKKTASAETEEKSEKKTDKPEDKKSDDKSKESESKAESSSDVPQKSLEEILGLSPSSTSVPATGPGATAAVPSDVPKPSAPSASSPKQSIKKQQMAKASSPAQRPNAQQLFNAIHNVYRSVESYKIEAVGSATIKHDGEVAMQSKDDKITIVFKRPVKFKMINEQAHIICDGKTIYNYIPKAKRYTKTKFSNEIVGQIISASSGVGVLGLTLGVDYTDAVASKTMLADSKVNGKETYVLKLKLKEGVAVPKGVDATQTLYIGKKDLIIYRNDLTTKGAPQLPKGYKGKAPKTVQTSSSTVMTNLDPNPKLSDSSFTFKPPKGVTLAEMPKPVDLKGKSAPDFSFKTADGSTKKLSDLKGKVVVLNFWALPMSEKQLPVLAKLNNLLGDDVELVTVNLNGQEQKDKMNKLLQEKGYSFPVIYADDAIGKVAMQQYKIMALPSMYIIDSKGVVRETLLGVKTSDVVLEKVKKVN